MSDIINSHAPISHLPHMDPRKLDFWRHNKQSTIVAIENQ